MREQLCLFPDNPEYDEFVDKFVPKKTTDDCYTPENVFEAVAGWACAEYGLDRAQLVRPFWPDMDFRFFEYSEGCVVLDNPPFSIRSSILAFYRERRIRFFLFSPALTLLTRYPDLCHIAVGADILYENGATVPTSFVTNLDSALLRTAPELLAAIDEANRANLAAQHKQNPRYVYPDEVITAAIAQRWCQYGIDYRLDRRDAVFIRALDAQRDAGKSIFGGGYLLTERAAAERAAAERAAAERAAAERAAATAWTLSDRERGLVSVKRTDL